MDRSENNGPPGVLRGFLATLAWLLWQAIRWPVLALLIVLEPIFRAALGLFALLGTLTALFWRFVVDPPGFPFFTVLAISLACIPALAMYYLVLRALAEG